MAVDQYRQAKKEDKNSFVIISVCLIIFFGLCLVNNNFYHFGDWWQIAIIIAMGVFTFLMLYWFIKELIKNPKGVISSLLMGLMLVLGFLCILTSGLTSLEMGLRKEILIIGTICFALPIIAILIARILKISKAEKVLEYGSIIIICILLLIGISYVISFLNPSVNGYQTFVTLFASFLGGGLTLIGVAWTINKSDYDKKLEEKKKVKPIIYAISYMSDYDYKEQIFIDFIKNEKSNERHFIGIIKNTDNGLCIIKEAIINGEIYKLPCLTVLDKNKAAQVIVYNDTRIDINSMTIIVEDVLGNQIKYNLTLNKDKQDIESIFMEE